MKAEGFTLHAIDEPTNTNTPVLPIGPEPEVLRRLHEEWDARGVHTIEVRHAA